MLLESFFEQVFLDAGLFLLHLLDDSLGTLSLQDFVTSQLCWDVDELLLSFRTQNGMVFGFDFK